MAVMKQEKTKKVDKERVYTDTRLRMGRTGDA